MPKFARPNAYTSKHSNQQWTGATRAANEEEAAAGEATNLYISPSTLAAAVGDLVPSASATVEGVVFLTEGTSSISYPVATKFYADNLRTAYPDLYVAKHFKGDSKNTARFGIPNACTTCHDERSPEWAARQMDEWWGDDWESVVLHPWQYSSFNANDPNAVKLPGNPNNDAVWKE